MPISRAFRRLVCRLMAGLMLLSQFAVAGYACPLPAAAAPAAVAVHCQDMDAAQKALCFEHCHPSSQGTDTASPPSPTPTPAMAPVMYVVPAIDVMGPVVTGPVPPGAAGPSPEVASAPPHAILHCVWRT
jgi:hypothetical protein